MEEAPLQTDQPQPRRRVLVAGLSPARKVVMDEIPTRTPPIATAPFRIGHGYDIHRLQAGGRLILGGVQVSDQISPIAHSDGDVVIHALVDGLLGAMGWGDIGEQFSDADAQWKNADSGIFLTTIYNRVKQSGYRVSNADITIMAERPKISPFKSQMVQTLRQALGAQSTVNIKAGTNEGCDAVGRGEAIAAHVVVLLIRDA